MQSGAPIENVSVYRPSEFRFAPSYSVEMAESAVQIFLQKTDALHADEQRMSFSIKSPGVGVIMSPQLILQMDFEVKAPGVLDYRQMIGPIYQAEDQRALGAAAESETGQDDHVLGYTPKLAFGEGDAVFNQLTSYQLVVNGAAVSNHSQNLYKRSLDQCQIPQDVWRTRWCMAGGQYQKYDSVAVSGEAYSGQSFNAGGGGVAYGADPKVVAFTADSGVQSRVEGLLGCVTGVQAIDGARDVFKVTVRAPVSGCGVFNPLAPDDDCASSCPLQRSLFALAHMNNVQLDFLFENLKQGLFRNLTGQATAGGRAGGFEIRLMGSGGGEVAPQLHSRWIRLSSYRSIPDVITCSTYRNTVHRSTNLKRGAGCPEVVPAAILEGAVAVKNAIPPSGIGRRANARCAQRVTDRYLEVEWRAIQAAQPPQYLFFTMQKDARIFCLEGDSVQKQIADFDTYAAGAPPAAGDDDDGQRAACLNQFYARNTASNAAILNFSLEIQSSVGAYTYASDTDYPYIKTKFELWRDHIKNTCRDYCSNDINIWRKNNCCLLLHACDWLRGLTTTNCAFPIQINATCRFENKREFIDGAAASSSASLTPVLHDIIAGEPVMVMLYPNTSLTLTASSGAASAANFSHSSGLDLLSRKV